MNKIFLYLILLLSTHVLAQENQTISNAYPKSYSDPAKAFIHQAYSDYADLWWAGLSGNYDGCGYEDDSKNGEWENCLALAERTLAQKYLSPRLLKKLEHSNDQYFNLTCLDGGPSFEIEDLQIERLTRDYRYNACMPMDYFKKLPDGSYDYHLLSCMRYTLAQEHNNYFVDDVECYHLSKSYPERSLDYQEGDEFMYQRNWKNMDPKE